MEFKRSVIGNPLTELGKFGRSGFEKFVEKPGMVSISASLLSVLDQFSHLIYIKIHALSSLFSRSPKNFKLIKSCNNNMLIAM